MKKYNGIIIGLQDLTGGEEPSKLFYILANKLRYLLDNDCEQSILAKDIKRCRKLNTIFKLAGSHFLLNPQIFENRNFLLNPYLSDVPPDTKIQLPKEPVIWVANHGFKDDGLATILAASRNAYLFFGSLPQFYNTVDGITAWLNGVVMFNRKVTASRRASILKAIRTIKLGTDLIVFPEGVWNKSPNALLIDLWPGIYRIACETGARIVPIVHYIRDFNNKGKNNPIHTVIDDPIRIDDLSERAALEYIRDVLATWFYLMMEIYGKTTREELLQQARDPIEVWESQLSENTKTVSRYDKEIELNAAYYPKWKVTPREVYRSFDGILLNLNGVIYADTDSKEDRLIGKESCVKLLKQGENLLIYPEGAWNITSNQVVIKLFTGAVEMAIRGEAQIVPIAMENQGNTYYVNIGKNIDDIMSQTVSGYTVEEIERTRYRDKSNASSGKYLVLEKTLIFQKQMRFFCEAIDKSRKPT